MNKNKKQRNSKRGPIYYIKRHWQLYLMILPALLYYLIFVYKPMGGIVIAFQDYSLRKGIWGSEWIGFENFTRLFNS